MTRSVLGRNNVRVVGTGPHTIVFGHGFGTDQTAWHHQQAAFAGTHRLVLFDHLGAGGSDISAYSPRRYRSLHSFADDLIAILTELDIKDAVRSSNDIAVPPQVGEYLASHIPSAKLLVIDAQGHLPHMSAPEAVTDAIRSFLP